MKAYFQELIAVLNLSKWLLLFFITPLGFLWLGDTLAGSAGMVVSLILFIAAAPALIRVIWEGLSNA